MEDKAFEAYLAAAKTAGASAGRNAAAWWQQDAIGGRTSDRADTRANAQRTLDGIDDGDPEIIDGLPLCDLSGQWADGLSETDIMADLDWPIDDAGEPDQDGWDKTIEAFRDAYDEAMIAEVERVCRYQLGA
jgi:hypothetical protein